MYREKEIKKGNLQNDDDDDVCYTLTAALYFQILFQLLLFYFIFLFFSATSIHSIVAAGLYLRP